MFEYTANDLASLILCQVSTDIERSRDAARPSEKILAHPLIPFILVHSQILVHPPIPFILVQTPAPQPKSPQSLLSIIYANFSLN